MLEYDFESSVGYWISLTSHFYQQQINNRLSPYGITYRQFQVLAWLAFEGALTHAELAERLMVERPTLTGILDRMEREGWVARRANESDRRSKRVDLQPAAKRVWDRIVGCLAEVRRQATDGMSPLEIAELQRLLAKVQVNLGVQQVMKPAVLDSAATGETCGELPA